MGRVRVRYVRQKAGAYYFEATPAMKAAGIGSRPLGRDLAAALARAEYLLAQWDAHRMGAAEKTYTRGTVRWLIREFERSTWYGDLSPRTREETDRHLGIIAAEWGAVQVAAIQRKHCRLLHDRRTEASGRDHANRTIKWLRRLLHYAVEIGARDTNPANRMGLKHSPPRRVVWTGAEVRAFCKKARAMGHPSWALAVRLGYDTAGRLSDVLGLTWHQWDGEGFTFRQGKTGAEVWVPVSAETRRALEAAKRAGRRSTHVIVGDRDGKPIKQRGHFSRIFRKIRDAAGLRAELTFHDLRRTGATEVSAGGGNVEHLTGHRPGSTAIRHYVVPNKAAARAAQKARRKNKK